MTITENAKTAAEVADGVRWSDHDGITRSIDDNGTISLTRADGAEFWLSDDRWAGSAGWTWTTVTADGEQVESGNDDDAAPPVQELRAWLRAEEAS